MAFVTSNDTTSGFIQAVLQALVRWCLKRGVRSAQVEELVRQTFVHEAQREIKEAKSEFSVSKVSVITGLHRTEVSRLLSGDERSSPQHNILNRVIGLWSGAKRYRNKDGSIRTLTHEGLNSEFAALVALVSKEITHYPILFELERIGAIEYQGNSVKLIAQGYAPQGDVQYGLDLLALDANDLVSAVESNILQKNAEPSLHLRTSFDNINPIHLSEIRLWIHRKGIEFHTAIREYLSQYDRDIAGSEDNDKAKSNQVISQDVAEERAQVSVTSFSIAEPIKVAKTIMPKKRGRKRCA